MSKTLKTTKRKQNRFMKNGNKNLRGIVSEIDRLKEYYRLNPHLIRFYNGTKKLDRTIADDLGISSGTYATIQTLRRNGPILFNDVLDGKCSLIHAYNIVRNKRIKNGTVEEPTEPVKTDPVENVPDTTEVPKTEPLSDLKSQMVEAYKKRESECKLTMKEEMELPLTIFVVHVKTYYAPASYGPRFERKMIYDHSHILKNVNRNDNLGDATIGGVVYIEIKVVYTGKGKGVNTLRFTNLRFDQKFDYFIFGIIDVSEGFKERYYCIRKDIFFDYLNPIVEMTAQNGTKKANENNEVVPLCFNANKNVIIPLLDKLNVLRGTEHKDLTDYLEYLAVNIPTEVVVEPTTKRTKKESGKPKRKYTKKSKTETTISKGNKRTKRLMSFIVDGVEIFGKNNMDTLTMFVKTIGAEKAKKLIWNAYFSNTPVDGWAEIENGTYFNNKISFRNMSNMMSKKTGKLGLNAKLIEKK